MHVKEKHVYVLWHWLYTSFACHLPASCGKLAYSLPQFSPLDLPGEELSATPNKPIVAARPVDDTLSWLQDSAPRVFMAHFPIPPSTNSSRGPLRERESLGDPDLHCGSISLEWSLESGGPEE
ncbi:hypothetical protein RRG08_062276 [Elysia crispata]|uniref:Uncharacterized protein n=1 Tax=Elysia crispata TaxID=231223 RepID=A0AAE0YG27_9GAST|nr:hypothetical protein RRG08_062276 [Elysia crispata]